MVICEIDPLGVHALDHVYREWNDKAAGIVSYGGWAAGVRAAETLRLVLAELRVATVRARPLRPSASDPPPSQDAEAPARTPTHVTRLPEARRPQYHSAWACGFTSPGRGVRCPRALASRRLFAYA
ncbi:NADPH-dependent FMN reductase [Nonomuraea maritima]|uniref:NADPH-dependent FMN reductase n=1 Tax=Nonomuraea maritima TaxID=683260 RepID=UPI000B8747AA|nr:NAD(P)H-dependent oxidoreductase [Nonomuraea maritima]